VDLNWGWRLDVAVRAAIGDVVKRLVDCRFEEAGGIQDGCRDMRPVFIILLSPRRTIFQMMDSARNVLRRPQKIPRCIPTTESVRSSDSEPPVILSRGQHAIAAQCREQEAALHRQGSGSPSRGEFRELMQHSSASQYWLKSRRSDGEVREVQFRSAA